MTDPASLIDAAQHAAAAGDYDAAERLLRDAVATQEATLGSSHPDLATTLNNLAFVCERTGKVDEAESEAETDDDHATGRPRLPTFA